MAGRKRLRPDVDMIQESVSEAQRLLEPAKRVFMEGMPMNELSKALSHTRTPAASYQSKMLSSERIFHRV